MLAATTLYSVAASALVPHACAVGSSASIRTMARRHELATLRACGMRRATLVLLLELKALWITVIGALLGFGIASLAAWSIRQESRPLPEPDLLRVASVIGVLIAVFLLAALVPALQAARHDVARGLALLHPDA